MDHKYSLPIGMKGVYTGSSSAAGGHNHKKSGVTGTFGASKGRRPAYWGIDLVMVALSIALTVLVAMNWNTILFVTAQIVSKILVVVTILVVLALIVAVVLGIRNKRVW